MGFTFGTELTKYLLNTISSWGPYLGILLVSFTGANLDVMEIDAAQYASISLELTMSDNWLQILDRQEDYLDKPPLLFWLSAISFNLFGVGNWQYKLPSILISLIGIFSTYKLGERLYNKKIGHLAAIIFGSCLATIMTNNDVKTDTILVASIVFSIWMLVSAIQTNKLKFFFGAGIGIAAATLTKGPIGLMMPLLAVGGHITLKNKWSSILNWKWLISILIVAISLIPMCIGLYNQHGTDGLKFYFWTQSFGRITGESEWNNNTTPLYFIPVFLWAFIPWTLLGLSGIISQLKAVFSNKKAVTEFYTISGIVLVWLALSLSRFKLPHYIFVVFPLIAILTAKYIVEIKRFIYWSRIQLIISALLILLITILLPIIFPDGGKWVSALLVLLLPISIWIYTNELRVNQLILPSCIAAIALGLGLNLHFYPSLLKYQANAQAGKWIVENNIDPKDFYVLNVGVRGLDFYARHTTHWTANIDEIQTSIEPGKVIYVDENDRNQLIESGFTPKQEIAFENFRVQRLTLEFLNPTTRAEVLSKRYLMIY